MLLLLMDQRNGPLKRVDSGEGRWRGAGGGSTSNFWDPQVVWRVDY